MRTVLLVLMALEGVAAAARDAYLMSYGGYATTEVAVIRGRVGRGKPAVEKPGRGGAAKVWATTRTFFGRDVEHARLRIVAGPLAAPVVADDDGFFEARLRGPFPAGRRRFDLLLDQPGWRAAPLSLELDVVDATSGYVVVTDIDDTIIETGVTGGKARMIARVASSDAHDIRAFDGAAEALATFAASGVPVVYLSASPVELGPRLMRFLALRGFPPGALFLRHYEDDGFGDPTRYKRARFEKVLADFPGRQLILFGDNGEKDPEIFATLAKDTGRVAIGYVRATLAAAAAESRYDGIQLFAAWPEVVAHARGAGLLK
jgi:phosphatidate phosphatase APP1